MVMLLVNDHLLKARWPGHVTGKISDVAGLVFFPLLLGSAWELTARIAVRRSWSATPKVMLGCILVTMAGFTAVKLNHATSDLYVHAMERITGTGHEIAPDPTDLLTLPATAVAWLVHRSTWRPTELSNPGLS